MPRYFVAIFIPENIRGAISARRVAAPPVADVRWVSEESLHITLNFLGEIDEARRPAIESVLRALAARHRPLRLRCAGAGVFPSPGRASSFWLGVRGDVERLSAIAGELSAGLAAEGFPQETREFQAHLTVARRDGRRRGPMGGRPGPALEFQAIYADFSSAEFCVEELHLVLSRPGPSGPRYTSVLSVPLDSASGLL